MNIVIQILGIVLYILMYILLFGWIFFKIRNVVLIRKSNCKDVYNMIKKDIKKTKKSKYSFRIILIAISICLSYIVIGLIIGSLVLLMTFITLFGSAYAEAGGNAAFYDNLIELCNKYFSIFKYIFHYILIIIDMILIRIIYINKEIYKKLNVNY